MVYVALLRGINVGGNGMISMAALKKTFERLGFGDVRTYINSGNVIFTTRAVSPVPLAKRIEDGIGEDFGFPVKVVLRTRDDMVALLKVLPNTWQHDEQAQCHVMFLSREIDAPTILSALPSNPSVDTVRYTPGAVLWRIDRSQATRSRMTKIVGTAIYKNMTIRNANTVRKVHALMEDVKGD